MSERIIGLIALLPLTLAIFVLIQIFGMEMATVIIAAMIIPVLATIVTALIFFSTVYGICKIITG